MLNGNPLLPCSRKLIVCRIHKTILDLIAEARLLDGKRERKVNAFLGIDLRFVHMVDELDLLLFIEEDSRLRLTEDQLQEAEAAFRLLGDKPFRSLPFCVDYALQNYREPVAREALSEAAAEYLAVKTAQRERGLLSTLQLRNNAK